MTTALHYDIALDLCDVMYDWIDGESVVTNIEDPIGYVDSTDLVVTFEGEGDYIITITRSEDSQ